jgi:16S rRNA (cytosine967-C5)-methyltransferase
MKGAGAKRGQGAKHRPGEKRERVSPARRAAFEILRRVEESDAFASVLLASNEDELSREDRALSYEIVLGVLRHELWLDYLIEHYTGRKASKLDAPVRRSLRMGLYQLRFLSRIPPSAVVNESVKLAHMARVRSAAACHGVDFAAPIFASGRQRAGSPASFTRTTAQDTP